MLLLDEELGDADVGKLFAALRHSARWHGFRNRLRGAGGSPEFLCPRYFALVGKCHEWSVADTPLRLRRVTDGNHAT